ncbi:MAG: GH3 auxin-responsive promoter family protein [Schleiferiaceae bacterium]|nr:GH3 auxin-responsive promoter family protein [Schleiferiaceae bacterium]
MAFSPITDLLVWRLKGRLPRLRRMMDDPLSVQEEQLKLLVARGARTEYGKSYGLEMEMRLDSFAERLPVVNYESLTPWIERTMRGEQGLLWDGPISWFAKSSGTSNAHSKFIPVSRESLDDNHLAGGRDLLALYTAQREGSALFDGLSLRLGGSTKINELHGVSYSGDLSAIMIENLPFWAEWRSTPSHEIALMEEWEDKIEKIAAQIVKQNVTSLFGVPSWMLVLMRRVLEMKGADNLQDIWPNLELFAHGGVSYTPYRQAFESIFPHKGMMHMETYNASEGFFAIQDRLDAPGLLLLLDHGIYYEFIPMTEFHGRHSRAAIPLGEVTLHVDYALVISTVGGLWRYIVGDTVRFVTLAPYRIEISGRTRLFINAFGEELMMDNAERAMDRACAATGAEIADYTAGPSFMDHGRSGAHQWLIEFHRAPSDLEAFALVLDAALQELNSDYQAKRHKDLVLRAPQLHSMPAKCFHNWLKSKGKLGGQNKVPRLSNDRKLLEEILLFQADKV